MPTLPAVIVTLLLPFERLFDPRTWRKAQLLAMGAILSPGKRTVSSALNILGIGQHGDFAIYHHVLNRARWSPLQLSRVLLLLVAGRLGSSTEPLVFGIDEDGGTTLGPEDCGQGAVSGSSAVQGRPGGDDPRIAMGEPDVADAYRMGGPTLGAAVFDRAGGVGPLRPAQRSPAQDGHRLRPADAGLPAPLAAGPGPGGGGRWRLRQAGVPAALPEYVKARLSSSPNCARTHPCTSPRHRGGPARSGGPGWSARDCPVPRRCWTIPLHNGFPTAPPVPTAVPPWSSSLRAWRCGTTAGRRAFPYVGSSSDTWRSAAGPMLCYAPTPRRNPCGYCSGICCGGRSR